MATLEREASLAIWDCCWHWRETDPLAAAVQDRLALLLLRDEDPAESWKRHQEP
jgi:hypothetical protein